MIVRWRACSSPSPCQHTGSSKGWVLLWFTLRSLQSIFLPFLFLSSLNTAINTACVTPSLSFPPFRCYLVPSLLFRCQKGWRHLHPSPPYFARAINNSAKRLHRAENSRGGVDAVFCFSLGTHSSLSWAVASPKMTFCNVAHYYGLYEQRARTTNLKLWLCQLYILKCHERWPWPLNRQKTIKKRCF